MDEPDADGAQSPMSPAASATAALAIDLRRARERDNADPKMDAFLDEQTELVRRQKEHLHEQRVLVLSRRRRGEALMLSGRYAEARRQFKAANGLELSVGDRTALDVLLARTTSGPLHG